METAGQSATNPYAEKRTIQSESGRLTQTAYTPYVACVYTHARCTYHRDHCVFDHEPWKPLREMSITAHEFLCSFSFRGNDNGSISLRKVDIQFTCYCRVFQGF